jgi:hypothetical protein
MEIFQWLAARKANYRDMIQMGGHMKKVILLLIVSATVSGCATKPKIGIVGWSAHFGVGSFAPDVPFFTSGGKNTTLHHEREPIALVAFVEPMQDGEPRILPELANLSERFASLPLTVVQITMATDKCQDVAGLVAGGLSPGSSMIGLWDLGGIAWRAYDRPLPNTVFLIDRHGTIRDIGRLEELDSIIEQAERLAWQADVDSC